MLTFSYDFDSIATSPCFLSQGIGIDVKPVKRFANGVLVSHLETILPVITHIIGYNQLKAALVAWQSMIINKGKIYELRI